MSTRMLAPNHVGEPANFERTKLRPLSVATARSATFEPSLQSYSSLGQLLLASSVNTVSTQRAG